MSHWIELASGLLAAVIGIAVALLALSLGAAFWAVGLLFLVAIGVGIGAYQHTRNQRAAWVRVLWISSLLLLCMTFLTMFTIGVYLMPAALLALLASITGSIRRGPDTDAARS
jgi:hypothetical protein